MSWAIVASAGAGLVGSLASSKKTSTTPIAPDVYNAYGEKNVSNTGAIASRDALFKALAGYQPELTTATGNYASALTDAATDPRLGASSDYAMRVLGGDYLTSPVVDRYAALAGNQIRSAGADTRARTGAALARGGMGFSTGMLQAAQTGDAAAAVEAARTEAGIKSQNYQAERANQMQAPSLISSAVAQPISYLSMVPGAYLNPLTAQAGLTSTLLGSNQIKDQTLMQNPSLSDSLAKGVGMASSIYDLFKGFGGSGGSDKTTYF